MVVCCQDRTVILWSSDVHWKSVWRNKTRASDKAEVQKRWDPRHDSLVRSHERKQGPLCCLMQKMDFENEKNCRRFPLITAIYCGTKEILYMYHERRYVSFNHHLPAPAQSPYSTMQNGILRQDIEDESLGKRHQIPSNF